MSTTIYIYNGINLSGTKKDVFDARLKVTYDQNPTAGSYGQTTVSLMMQMYYPSSSYTTHDNRTGTYHSVTVNGTSITRNNKPWGYGNQTAGTWADMWSAAYSKTLNHASDGTCTLQFTNYSYDSATSYVGTISGSVTYDFPVSITKITFSRDNLASSRSILSKSGSGTTTTTLTWTAATAGVNNSIKEYRIYYGTTSSSVTTLLTSVNTNSYSLNVGNWSKLSRGTTYYLTVKAISNVSSSFDSDALTPVSIYICTQPTAPTINTSNTNWAGTTYLTSNSGSLPTTAIKVGTKDSHSTGTASVYYGTSLTTQNAFTSAISVPSSSTTYYFWTKDSGTNELSSPLQITFRKAKTPIINLSITPLNTLSEAVSTFVCNSDNSGNPYLRDFRTTIQITDLEGTISSFTVKLLNKTSSTQTNLETAIPSSLQFSYTYSAAEICDILGTFNKNFSIKVDLTTSYGFSRTQESTTYSIGALPSTIYFTTDLTNLSENISYMKDSIYAVFPLDSYQGYKFSGQITQNSWYDFVISEKGTTTINSTTYSYYQLKLKSDATHNQSIPLTPTLIQVINSSLTDGIYGTGTQITRTTIFPYNTGQNLFKNGVLNAPNSLFTQPVFSYDYSFTKVSNLVGTSSISNGVLNTGRAGGQIVAKIAAGGTPQQIPIRAFSTSGDSDIFTLGSSDIFAILFASNSNWTNNITTSISLNTTFEYTDDFGTVINSIETNGASYAGAFSMIKNPSSITLNSLTPGYTQAITPSSSNPMYLVSSKTPSFTFNFSIYNAGTYIIEIKATADGNNYTITENFTISRTSYGNSTAGNYSAQSESKQINFPIPAEWTTDLSSISWTFTLKNGTNDSNPVVATRSGDKFYIWETPNISFLNGETSGGAGDKIFSGDYREDLGYTNSFVFTSSTRYILGAGASTWGANDSWANNSFLINLGNFTSPHETLTISRTHVFTLANSSDPIYSKTTTYTITVWNNIAPTVIYRKNGIGININELDDDYLITNDSGPVEGKIYYTYSSGDYVIFSGSVFASGTSYYEKHSPIVELNAFEQHLDVVIKGVYNTQDKVARIQFIDGVWFLDGFTISGGSY